MKVIQIVPAQRMIITHELKDTGDVGRLKQFQELVGGNIETAHMIDDNHRIFVNEEGLFEPDRHYFYYNGAHQPFAGNGIIVTEDNTDCDLNPAYVLKNLKFFNENEIKEFLIEMGLEDL